jgi:xanthine dehydrogenase molybdopterin-binding subunit B
MNYFCFRTNPDQKTPFQYYSYGATIAEVDFDVLTGEHQLTRVDVLFDCGERYDIVETFGKNTITQ